MKSQYKIAFLSIGGAAIAAGAYYYFYRRNLSIQERYYKILNSFKYEVFSCNSFQLSNLNLIFDQLLHFATYDESNPESILSEKIQYQDLETLRTARACGKSFENGQIYYECLDCSPIRQELKNTKKVAEKGQVYLVLCEDCFLKKHKDHNFQRHDSGMSCDFKCHCGQSSFMDKQNFCCDHQGYEQSKVIFDQQLKQNAKLWNGVEQFFLDVFYIVFENMCELQREITNQKIQQEKMVTRIERINLILDLIFKKMTEIIELNPTSIHFMPNILLKRLHKPIQLELIQQKDKNSDEFQWVRKINKEKKINNDLSILDYIFLLYKFIDNSNDKEINQTFHTLLKVDESFKLKFCETFFKTFRYSLRDLNKKVENYAIVNEGYLPSCSFLIVEYICFNEVFYHLLETLGLGIFEPLNFLIEYITEKERCIAELDYVQYILLNIGFEMLRFVNQVKALLQRYPNELIKKLHQLCLVLFIKNSFEPANEQPEQFIALFVCTLLQYRQLEKHVIYCFINICEGLLLIDDQQLITKIFPILIQNFKETVVKARQFLDLKNKENQPFCTASITLISHLPLLVALSEKKMFSKEVISSFFQKNFQFENESSKQNFFLSLQMIARSFQAYCQDVDLYQLVQLFHKFLEQSEQRNFYNSLAKAQEDFFYSCDYRVYDFLTLTYSIILLEDEYDPKKKGYHIQNQYIHAYLDQISKLIQGQQINPIKSSTITSVYATLYQLIGDSMPFFNVFSSSYHLYFPELAASENNEAKALFQKNAEEFIITIVNSKKDSKMYIKDVLQLSSQLIYETKTVEKYISGICEKNVNENESQEIILQPQYKQKFYSRHLLRQNISQVQDQLQILNNKFQDSQEEYTSLGTDFSIQNLFPYQRDLYKKLFLNEVYVQELVKILFLQTKYVLTARSISYQIFIILKLIQSKSSSEFFTEQELSVIEKITEILKNKMLLDYYSVINTKIDARERLKFPELIDVHKLIHKYLQKLHQN